jgi:prephenate dehydrogenase
VVGSGSSQRSLERALELGVIDSAGSSTEEALEGAHLCFVCAPVGALVEVAAEALACGGDAVVSDVGSTKCSVLDGLAAAGLSQPDLSRFVGGHPLAGAETAGVEHATADLFQDARWYLTPTESTSGVHYDRLYRAVSGLGARPAAIGPQLHDRLMATVSHLPHVLANVLVNQAARALGEESQTLPATGPSFRDATRVAGANPPLWRDILMANRDAVDAELARCIDQLEQVRAQLRAGDADALERSIGEARADRQRLLEVDLAGGPVSEVLVSVPNRPGIVAQLALALGEAGVNIVDMALYPAPDMNSGAIALWVAGEGSAERVTGLIEGLGYRAWVSNGGEEL